MGEVSARLEDLPLRDDLRGQTPYGAPQAPLPVALNVNENTHPVPEEVADDILDAVALALRDVNRYPDREFIALREGFADYLGFGLTRRPDLGGERVERGAAARSAGLRRSRAHRVRLRADLLHVSAPHAGHRRRLDRGHAIARLHRRRRERGIPGRGCRARRRVPVRPEQPDRHADAARRHRGGLRRDATASWSSTRPTRSSRPHSEPSALTLLPGRERLIVSRTMSKAFAFAGARVGYLAADAAVDRRAAARSPAVPPQRADAGGGDSRAAACPDDAAHGR